mgnify:CR=1 FL=1
MAGSTLRPYCRADQLLSLELIVEIGFKCAMALGYVYRQGLIHRDVKPANLLAVLNNSPITAAKISDFARVLNLRPHVTTRNLLDPLAYIPPHPPDRAPTGCRPCGCGAGSVQKPQWAGPALPISPPTPAGIMIISELSLPPASSSSTRLVPSSVSRFASTQPAEPAPMMM